MILLAATLTAVLAILGTTDSMPERVASGFGGGGEPHGWMTRDFYRAWMTGFAAGLPWLLFGAIALAPRLWPHLVNLPHRDYWLAEPRRERTLAFLAAHASALGCLTVLFVVGMHFLLAHSNALVPPRLPTGLFLAVLGTFLAALAIWMVAMVRRFPRPPAAR